MVKEKLLTKSLYLRGLQCEKSLWLKINNSDVLTKEDRRELLELYDVVIRIKGINTNIVTVFNIQQIGATKNNCRSGDS